MGNITQIAAKPKSKNTKQPIPPQTRQTEAGHTVIDVLIARAGVLCVLGRDFAQTIETARKLAALAEGRACV